MAPSPTPIYHITHFRNLERILHAGCLTCGADLQQAGTDYLNIAQQNIQDRRRWTTVPCGAGGVLHDYVPFYFAPRSPMLYVINAGAVQGYADGQEPIVHLVAAAQAVIGRGLAFVFTDGHGTMDLTEFYDDLHDLDKVDWAIMKAKYWTDTQEIGVLNARMGTRVEEVLHGVIHHPVVNVHAGWYY